MKIAMAKLVSAAPYSQSKPVASEKSRDETHRDFEERTWKERCHVNNNGQVFIPPMAFKNSLSEAAKYKPVKIPGGGGKANYTKHVEGGVLVTEPLVLPVKIDDVEGEWLFVPSDGRRGGGKRVWKCFPVIQDWEGTVAFNVFDDILDNEVFEQYLDDMGRFIGIGRFRPRNNGFYGRFSVEGVKWE